MASRVESVCGIDISKDVLSIAQYSAADNTVTNASIVINPLDDLEASADFVSPLKAKFHKLALQMRCQGQPAAVAVPANFAVVKNLMLDADEKNVRDAVGWELGQHIVGSIDDYAFDCEPLPDADGAVKRFLAVAYRNSSVSRLVSLLKNARIVPTVVDLDMFALVDVFEANYGDKLSAPVVIVHGSSDSSRIILTAGGAFVDFEIIEHYGGHAAADTYCAQVKDSAVRILSGREGQFETFVTGPLFADRDFCESVCFGVGNAQPLDPFKTIRSTAAIPEGEMTKVAHYLSVAVGLAIRCAAEAGA